MAEGTLEGCAYTFDKIRGDVRNIYLYERHKFVPNMYLHERHYLCQMCTYTKGTTRGKCAIHVCTWNAENRPVVRFQFLPSALPEAFYPSITET